MTTSRLRVGIVGCGGIARAHLAGYRSAANVDVACVYDVSRKAAQQFAEECGAQVIASPEDMVKAGLDAVSVCTPPATHLQVCRPFLRAGVPVLCEKPLEADARAAARLEAVVRSSGTLFMTAFCHRFHPAIVELKALIDAGRLGKPLLFRNIFGGYLELRGNHRAKPALSGGGSVIDNCSHAVDLFRYLAGEPTEVQALTGNVAQRGAVEDLGLLALSARGKVFGEITSSYSLKVCGNWVEWYGTLGTALVSYWNANQPDLVYRLAGEQEWTIVDCSAHPDRFSAEIAHFLDCVQTGAQPLITVADGHAASRIIDAAYKSARSGKRQNL